MSVEDERLQRRSLEAENRDLHAQLEDAKAQLRAAGRELGKQDVRLAEVEGALRAVYDAGHWTCKALRFTDEYALWKRVDEVLSKTTSKPSSDSRPANGARAPFETRTLVFHGGGSISGACACEASTEELRRLEEKDSYGVPGVDKIAGQKDEPANRPATAGLEDSLRVDFIEQHRKRVLCDGTKGDWVVWSATSCGVQGRGSTWREAVDSARKIKKAKQTEDG